MGRSRLAATVVLVVIALVVAACSSDLDQSAMKKMAGNEPSGPTGSPWQPPARAPVPPGSGPLGLKWNWAQTGTLPFVVASSGGWTFYEVEWCDVEPRRGHRHWHRLDQVVRDARRLGHEPMFKLRTGQCWATKPPTSGGRDRTEATTKKPSTPPSDLAAYLSFVRALVHRYAPRGVHRYAIENEPDVTNFWAAPLSAYARLVRRVAPVIRKADSRARIIDAGTSSTAYGVVLAADKLRHHPRAALRTYRRYYARRISGGISRWPAADSVQELRAILTSAPAHRAERAVQVNLRLANRRVVDAYQLHYYEPASQLDALLRYLNRHLHRSVAIEAWEIGVARPGSGYDARAQADDTFRIVGRLLAAGVRPIVYLPVAFTPSGRPQVFRGLVQPDGAVLASGNGWLALAEALARLHDGRVHKAGGGLFGATWNSDGRDAALVWAKHGRVSLDARDVDMILDATGRAVDGLVIGGRPRLVLGSAGGGLPRRLAHGR